MPDKPYRVTMIDLLVGVSAMTLALLALAGWSMDLPILASLVAGRIPMAPSTAMLLCLLGMAYILRAISRSSRPAIISKVIVGVATLSAAIVLVLGFFGVSIPIETMGFKADNAVLGVSELGHMSPITACCFMLLGLGFLLTPRHNNPNRAPYRASTIAIVVHMTLCSVFLAGYAADEPLLYGARLIPPALSTLLTFFALGFAQAVRLFRHRSGRFLPLDLPRSKPALILGGLSVIGIVLIGIVLFRGYGRQYRSEVESRLTAIAELKIGELTRFRKERMDDATELMSNPSFLRLAGNFLAHPADGDAAARLELDLLEHVVPDRYESVFLLDAGGRALFSIPRSRSTPTNLSPMQAREVFLAEAPVFQDFYRDAQDEKVYLSLLVPLYDQERDAFPIGILVLKIDPSFYLYPFIKMWPIPSASSETLLVRREGDTVLFLNDLKYRENAALRIRLTFENENIPSVKAALGFSGIMQGVDYRGVSVLASVGRVPGSPWLVVAKTDLDEAFAALRMLMWFLLFIIAILLGGIVAGFIAYHRMRDVRELTEKNRAMESLAETSAYLENLLDYANAPIIVWDQHYRITRFNHAFEALTGRRAEEVLGGSLDFLFPPEQASDSHDLIRGTSSGRRWETVEIDILSRDGSVRRLLWNSASVYSADGQALVATIAQGVDVTEARQSQARLIEQVEELRRWQEVMLDREDRIWELKKEINELLTAQGSPMRYMEKTPYES